MDILDDINFVKTYFVGKNQANLYGILDNAVIEIEKWQKLIKQYEAAMPALVKENEELREQVQQRTNFEIAIKDDNERLRGELNELKVVFGTY